MTFRNFNPSCVKWQASIVDSLMQSTPLREIFCRLNYLLVTFDLQELEKFLFTKKIEIYSRDENSNLILSVIIYNLAYKRETTVFSKFIFEVFMKKLSLKMCFFPKKPDNLLKNYSLFFKITSTSKKILTEIFSFLASYFTVIYITPVDSRF